MSYGGYYLVHNPEHNRVEVVNEGDKSIHIGSPYLTLPGNTSLVLEGLHHIIHDAESPRLAAVGKDQSQKILTDWVVDYKLEAMTETYKAVIIDNTPHVFHEGRDMRALWVTLCVAQCLQIGGRGVWSMCLSPDVIQAGKPTRLQEVQSGFTREKDALGFMADWVYTNRQQATKAFDLDILEACL